MVDLTKRKSNGNVGVQYFWYLYNLITEGVPSFMEISCFFGQKNHVPQKPICQGFNLRVRDIQF